ncbi:ABC transporter ATP-binding protein [Streptomyces malaysiensis subsp. malaysiensis]|uniref:ABC transporter ATP-binding protein n=1 Tax=Streptomyces malaysiensis TaxID=92644 RepID=A0ABX6WJ20_STRMQ|nr:MULTISPECIES: ABC transporter ATP-binding protein [Streptomyces]MCM3812670.1 ABC transporter ATP-binding protein [Streptomyces sp. DR7-3]QPI61412.1 ABC transporter ATP-binding protein [Streptomyces solisilvae]UHH23193.1 ABC transporter ATP-binding protein [Streptomyces sp. HNM0561]
MRLPHRPPPGPGTTLDTALDVRGLRVDFAEADTPSAPAVDGLDLTVRRGEIVALVGESGSGKTLTALSVMGLLPPGAQITEGRITLGDEDLTTLPPKHMNRIRGHRMAMLFQQPKVMLDPTCTVGSQVAEPLRLHWGLGRHQAKARVVELLRDVGIPEPERRASAYAHQLSGGMAQRVMIAAALAGEPGLLIADEPTTALDATVQAQILRLLRRKQRESSMSVLLITHDLTIVTSIADRVAVMYAGRVVEEGSVHEVFDSPEHPYTRALLKASLLQSEEGRLFSIPGSATQSRGLDHGCRFHPRCPLALDLGITGRCSGDEPPLHTCGGGHRCRCWASRPGIERVGEAVGV